MSLRLVFRLLPLLPAATLAGVDPDVKQSMTSIITEKGYPVEEHVATTEDGYILALYRIPNGLKGSGNGKRPAVLLQHGLLCSSFDWVANNASESLSFILADAGYDVWLANNRGNRYSKNHTTLSSSEHSFWDFSFDEYALKDLPTEIDYVLNVTKQSSLSYIGHSQGTLIGFAGFSANKELAAKVNLFVALAPVAYLYHNIYMSEGRIPFLIKLAQLLPNMGVLSNGGLNRAAAPFCRMLPGICTLALKFAGGFTDHLNKTREQVYLSRTPAGTSLKNIIHFLQGGRSNEIQKYDYGSSRKNVEKYGMRSPPRYNVSEIAVKTVLFRGSRDILADKKDIAQLIDILPSKLLVANHTVEGYAHLDFIWAPDANSLVYSDVLSYLKQYNPASTPHQIVV